MNVEGVDYIDITEMRTELTTGVDNRTVSDLKIARIHPPTYTQFEPVDEITDGTGQETAADDYGLTIISHGGIGADA